MAIKLVCVHPLDGFEKGQEVTDPKEVAKLLDEKPHYFVKVAAPDAPAASLELPASPALKA